MPNLEEEAVRYIRPILETLEPCLRDPIQMYYFENKSYKEIASSMDLPIGTIMSRIARAKVNLKRKLPRNENIDL